MRHHRSRAGQWRPHRRPFRPGGLSCLRCVPGMWTGCRCLPLRSTARGAYACDVRATDGPQRAVDAIRADLGAVDTLIYNAGAGAFASIDENRRGCLPGGLGSQCPRAVPGREGRPPGCARRRRQHCGHRRHGVTACGRKLSSVCIGQVRPAWGRTVSGEKNWGRKGCTCRW